MYLEKKMYLQVIFSPHLSIGCLYVSEIFDVVFDKDNKHEFHETCHPVTFHFMKEDFKRCCDTTTPESIYNKDESIRGSALIFIFGVNCLVQ